MGDPVDTPLPQATLSFKDKLIATIIKGKLDKIEAELLRYKNYLENRDSVCDAFFDQVAEQIKVKILQEAAEGRIDATIYVKFGMEDFELEFLFLGYIIDKIKLLPDFEEIIIEKSVFGGCCYINWKKLFENLSGQK